MKSRLAALGLVAGSFVAAGFVAVGALAVLPALAQPAAPQPVTEAAAKPVPRHTRCFFSNQFENWKAAGDKTIYIRVSFGHYYRLDLAAPCPALKWPGAFLISKIHGSESICSAIDWDLHVAQSWGDIPEACIVKTMTELTPAEVAALPKGSKP